MGEHRRHEDELFRDKFELGMDSLWEGLSPEGCQLLIDVPRYFSEFDPPEDGSDCYSKLVRSLIGHGLVDRTGMATLNYECIL